MSSHELSRWYQQNDSAVKLPDRAFLGRRASQTEHSPLKGSYSERGKAMCQNQMLINTQHLILLVPQTQAYPLADYPSQQQLALDGYSAPVGPTPLQYLY